MPDNHALGAAHPPTCHAAWKSFLGLASSGLVGNIDGWLGQGPERLEYLSNEHSIPKDLSKWGEPSNPSSYRSTRPGKSKSVGDAI